MANCTGLCVWSSMYRCVCVCVLACKGVQLCYELQHTWTWRALAQQRGRAKRSLLRSAPMKMERLVSSKTSALKVQMPGDYPKKHNTAKRFKSSCMATPDRRPVWVQERQLQQRGGLSPLILSTLLFRTPPPHSDFLLFGHLKVAFRGRRRFTEDDDLKHSVPRTSREIVFIIKDTYTVEK